jgi:hypothetical protein
MQLAAAAKTVRLANSKVWAGSPLELTNRLELTSILSSPGAKKFREPVNLLSARNRVFKSRSKVRHVGREPENELRDKSNLFKLLCKQKEEGIVFERPFIPKLKSTNLFKAPS